MCCLKGSFMGESLLSDTYVYQIEVEYFEDKYNLYEKIFKGDINLIR